MNLPYKPPTRHAYSPEQVKSFFLAAGVPVAQWAESNGYTRREVYMLLNGQFKGRYGRMHGLAIELGLKLSIEQLAA